MKTKLIALSLIAGASLAQAALYTLQTGTSSTSAGVVDKDGNPFRSGTTVGQSITGGNAFTSAGPGVVAFGFFSTDSLSSVANATDLVALFTQFGASGTFNAAGTSGNRGVFSRGNTGTIGTSPTGTFAGKSIYLFAGNGTTLSGSTQFLVAKMDSETFVSGDDATFATAIKTITISPSNSTALIGSEITNVFTTSTDTSTTAGWQMATLVPEPSTTLLGAFGALALLRRRRN